MGVYFSIAGTAAEGDGYGGGDYEQIGSYNYSTGRYEGSVVIPAGARGAVVRVRPRDDNEWENDETVELTLIDDPYAGGGCCGCGSGGGSYEIDAQSSTATATIADNDHWQLDIEASGDADEQFRQGSRFTVTRSGETDLSHPLMFQYAIDISDPDTADGGDYALAEPDDYTDGFVTIPAGETSAVIYLAPDNDAEREATESVTLTLAEPPTLPSGLDTYALAPDDPSDPNSPTSATVHIADNDQWQISIDLASPDSSVTIGEGSAFRFTIERDGETDLSHGLTVPLDVDGTASPYDYSLRGAPGYYGYGHTAYIPPGAKRVAVEVVAVEDGAEEDDPETVNVALAEDPDHYTIVPFPIEPVVDPPFSNVAVTIAPSAAGWPAPPDPATWTVNVSAAGAADEENDVGGSFTLTRSGGDPLEAALSVYVSISGALWDVDFYDEYGNGLGSGDVPSFTIPAGETSLKIWAVPRDDAARETTETLTLAIDPSPSGCGCGCGCGCGGGTLPYQAGSSASATIDIEDNDDWLVGIEAEDPDTTDAIGAIAEERYRVENAIKLTRSGESDLSHPVDVYFSLLGDADMSDYDLPGRGVTDPNTWTTDYTKGHYEIPAGQASATIPLKPVRDQEVEGDESVQIAVELPPDDPYGGCCCGLGGAGYAVGSPAEADVTIEDDLYVWIERTEDAVESADGTPPGYFELKRAGHPEETLDAGYTIEDSSTVTNKADFDDWLPGTGELNAKYGDILLVNPATDLLVPAIDDDVAEGSEHLDIALNEPPGHDPNYYGCACGYRAAYTLLSPSSDTVTIGALLADIDVDSDNSGAINPADTPEREAEDEIEDDADKPGMFVARNDDDDDENGVLDLHDVDPLTKNGQPFDDPDLKRGEFSIRVSRVGGTGGLPDGDADGFPDGYTATFSVSGAGAVKIWDSQSKQHEWITAQPITLEDFYGENATFQPETTGSFYVEGVSPGAVEITLTLKDAAGVPLHSDTVKVAVLDVDLDIDGDNTNGLAPPDRTEAEELAEDADGQPGKRVVANSWGNDKDADGVRDSWDGYDRDKTSGNADDQNSQEKFVPTVLEIPAPVDVSEAKIRIGYSAAGLFGDLTDGLRLWNLDAQQRTASAYLPPGTYSAADLGFDATHRSRTLYVEGVTRSGAVGDRPITVSIDPDGGESDGSDGSDGSTRFVTSDVVRVTVVGLNIIADVDGDHAIGGLDPMMPYVDIGHWGADTTGFTEGGTGVSGYREVGTLRNNYAEPNNTDPDKAWDNFIDRDPDRFYVSVIDPSKNQDPNAKDHFLVEIGSVKGGDFSVDDDMTEIQLTETGNDTGVFLSVAQLMMSPDLPLADNPDDKLAVHNGLPGAEGKWVADDTPGDRTHRTSIDGSLRLEYAGQQTGVPVSERGADDERRILTMHATVFNEPYTDANNNGQYDAGEAFKDISGDNAWNTVLGTQAAATAYVEAQVERANIAWAQAAIKVELAGGVNFVDAPTNANGVNIIQDGEFDDPDETKIVINNAAGVNFDVLEVYFVAPIVYADPNNEDRAFSVVPVRSADYPTIGENSFVFIEPGVDIRYRTLAHEIGHALTNEPDVYNPEHIFFSNILVYMDTDIRGAGHSTAYKYRRITHATEAEARTVRAAGNQTATGNRLLKKPQ